MLLARERSFYVLVLRRGRDLPLHRQLSEELRNLVLPHLRRVTFAMEEDKTADPIQLRLLGSDAVAAGAQQLPYLLEQFRLALGDGIRLNRLHSAGEHM